MEARPLLSGFFAGSPSSTLRLLATVPNSSTLENEDTVNIDTTVQEKNITYPTAAKLAIKIINRLHKVPRFHGVQQRRSFVKEIKNLRLSIRHVRHVKKRTKARKALKRLRTIAHILIRELRRTLLLPSFLFECYQKDFLFYERVRAQQSKESYKIYACMNRMCIVLESHNICLCSTDLDP